MERFQKKKVTGWERRQEVQHVDLEKVILNACVYADIYRQAPNLQVSDPSNAGASFTHILLFAMSRFIPLGIWPSLPFFVDMGRDLPHLTEEASDNLVGKQFKLEHTAQAK